MPADRRKPLHKGNYRIRTRYFIEVRLHLTRSGNEARNAH